MSIIVAGIQKRYGNQLAVGGVSFELQRGEIVGFLGPNGAGKSTTLKMITGYVQPDAGTIWVEGLSVETHSLAVRKKIGYLPESNPLYYDMYVREYLHFIAGIHGLLHPDEPVKKVIEMTGLNREAHKRCGQLSKGYKQRVGLAAALVHNPPVLILDEPTSGLDPNQIVEIREVIRKQGADKTILFSSHILQEVEAICDRVIILHQGKVVADNRIRQLQQEENSGQVLEVQLREEVAEQEWREVPGVQQLIAMGGGRYRISTQDAEQLSRALMQWTVQKGYTLLSFQREESSLEDVFRQLTSQQP
ncbi:MAG: ATP-binding cassette domain-containing protein [Sediminibacterium sp.]